MSDVRAMRLVYYIFKKIKKKNKQQQQLKIIIFHSFEFEV